MTFIGIMKQNGVGSVGTLFRECMGRVVFRHEGLNKITGGCYKKYHRIDLHIKLWVAELVSAQ